MSETPMQTDGPQPPETADLKRLRRAGAIAAGIGLLMGLWPLFVAAMAWGQGAGFEGGILEQALAVFVLTLQTTIGFVLFFAGLAFRRRKEWGRKTILFFVWAGIVNCLAFIVFWQIMIPLTMGLDAASVGFMVFGPAITAIWVLILWVPKRYFSSPEVREACRSTRGAGAGGAGGMSRRRLAFVTGIIVALPVLMACGLYAIWWHKSAADLHAEIRGIERSGASLRPADFKPPLPAPDDNAADLVREAGSQMRAVEERVRDAGWVEAVAPDGDTRRLWRDLLELPDWTPEEAAYAQRLVTEDSEALESLRKAPARPHADFDWDYSDPIPVLDGFDDVGQGVQLLCLSGLVAARDGNQRQAVSDIAAALRLAAFPDRDPILVVTVVRASSASTAIRCCARLLRSDDVPAQLMEPLQAPLRDVTRGLDLARSVECERAWLLQMWGAILSGDWTLLNMEPPGRPKALLARPLLMSQMAAVLPLANEAVSIARKPISEAAERMPELQDRIQWAYEAAGRADGAMLELPNPVSLIGSYEMAIRRYADCRALLGAGRVAIALRLYRADTGTPALALRDLVPDYLEQVPRDPYTGHTLLLERADGFVTVYSVGHDLQDDGGLVNEDPERYERPDIGVRIRE